MSLPQCELQAAFKRYDEDGSGGVTLKEASTVLKEDLGLSEANTERLLNSHDTNKDGKLDYEEFVSFYIKVKERKDELQKIFTELDTDGNGRLSEEEFLAATPLKNMDLSETEMLQLFKTCDTNNDGYLQFEEFRDLWNS